MSFSNLRRNKNCSKKIKEEVYWWSLGEVQTKELKSLFLFIKIWKKNKRNLITLSIQIGDYLKIKDEKNYFIF